MGSPFDLRPSHNRGLWAPSLLIAQSELRDQGPSGSPRDWPQFRRWPVALHAHSSATAMTWRPVAIHGHDQSDPACSLHTKLAASFVLPLPPYSAKLGNGQSGRVIRTPLAGLSPLNLVATICSGAWPCSTHRTSGPTVSKMLGPGPPPQCKTPGARKSRKNSCVSPTAPAPWPACATTLRKELMLLRGAIAGSSQPCH